MSLHWLPNAISALRILLVPPLGWLIVGEQYSYALLIFLIAGASDGLDGFLAKTFGWHSRLGALLDPLADKLLLVVSFVTLCSVGLIPFWLTAIVVLRDLVIVGGAAAYHFLIQPLAGQPTLISKLNTGLELLFVLSTLAAAAYGLPSDSLVLAVGAAVFVTVVISGMDYVWSWSVKARRDSR